MAAERTTLLASSFQVTVGSRRLGSGDLPVVRVAVDEDQVAPALAVVDLAGPDAFGRPVPGAIGDVVTVEVEVDGREAVRLFEGEVTGIAVELDGTASRVQLRCFDRGHRLQRATTTRTFLGATVTDVVRELASDAGIELGRVSDSRVRHEHLTQANVDDWSFLQHLAGRLGWVCAMERGRLGFHPVEAAPGPEVAVDRWADDVGALRAQVTAAQQVPSVEVRAWDPATQESLASTEQVSTDAASAGTDPARLGQQFSGGAVVVTSEVYDSIDEVAEAARGLARRVGGTFAEVEAEVAGNPELGPGRAVLLSSFGAPVDGSFVVTAVEHVWEPGPGYRSRFTVSDRQDRSLLGLASAGAGGPVNRIHSLVPAVVSNVDDDEGLDRVKLTLPWLDDQLETGWARTVQVGAGSGRGNRFVPEVGDEVLVGFEQGDIHRPYVLGGLYSAAKKPFEGAGRLVSGGVVQQRVLSSRTGQRIVLSDVDDDLCVKIVSGDDATTLVVGGRDAGVTITTRKKVVVTSDGDVSMEAKGDLMLKGRSVKVEAVDAVSVKGNGQVSVEGATVAVKGQAQVQIEASGVTSVKGALVEVN